MVPRVQKTLVSSVAGQAITDEPHTTSPPLNTQSPPEGLPDQLNRYHGPAKLLSAGDDTSQNSTITLLCGWYAVARMWSAPMVLHTQFQVDEVN